MMCMVHPGFLVLERWLGVVCGRKNKKEVGRVTKEGKRRKKKKEKKDKKKITVVFCFFVWLVMDS